MKEKCEDLFEWNGKELYYQIYPFTRYNVGENKVKNEMIYAKSLVDSREKELEYTDGYIKLKRWNEYLIIDGEKVCFGKEKKSKWLFEKVEEEERIVSRRRAEGRWIYEDVETKETYQNECASWCMKGFILIQKE
jgi:hypothetical protein